MSRGMWYLPSTTWAKKYVEVVATDVCQRGGRRYVRGTMMIRVECPEGLYRGDGTFRVELKSLSPTTEIPEAAVAKPKSAESTFPAAESPVLESPKLTRFRREMMAERERRATADWNAREAGAKAAERASARHDVGEAEYLRPDGKRKGGRKRARKM